MSFASVGGLGNGNNKAASRTVSMTVGAAVPVGGIVVVWVAWDAHGPSGGSTNGNYTPREMCSDSKGNFYTQLGGHEDSATTNPGFAVFISQLRVALTTSDTITAANSNSVPVAKGITAWQFSCAAGMGWAVSDLNNRVTTLGADPATISCAGTLDSQEYLMIHCLASKGPTTDAYTWDSNYTQVGTGGTTGGTDISNVAVTGGFRIATATGGTVNVTATTAFRNYLQGIYPICEAPIPNFPTTPILDNFNRADENPLDNGTWDTTTTALTTTRCQITSNQARGIGGSWWLDPNTGTDYEVYCSHPVKCGTPGVIGPGLLLNGSGDASHSTLSAYQAEWETAATTDRDHIEVYDGNQFVGTAIVAANGNKLGLCKIQKVLWCFVNVGSGWEPANATYYQGNNKTSGKIGLMAGDSVARMDDFGGGPRITFMPQIIRRRA